MIPQPRLSSKSGTQVPLSTKEWWTTTHHVFSSMIVNWRRTSILPLSNLRTTSWGLGLPTLLWTAQLCLLPQTQGEIITVYPRLRSTSTRWRRDFSHPREIIQASAHQTSNLLETPSWPDQRVVMRRMELQMKPLLQICCLRKTHWTTHRMWGPSAGQKTTHHSREGLRRISNLSEILEDLPRTTVALTCSKALQKSLESLRKKWILQKVLTWIRLTLL